jgi:type VI secretion system secreted protein VgrG
MSSAELLLESGEPLDVRSFEITERLSTPFRIRIVAVSSHHDLDFEATIGRPAALRVTNGAAFALVPTRTWVGVCTRCEQTRVEAGGLSTYELTLESQLWLLGQRRTHRVFQHLTAPQLVSQILTEWNVEHDVELDPTAYRPLELRVQYGETDLAFLTRILEEAGISFVTVEAGTKMRLVLRDAPQSHEERPSGPITFIDSPQQAQAAQVEYATLLSFRRAARSARVVLRDFDFRNPSFELVGVAAVKTDGVEDAMEDYRFTPGRFLTEGHQGGETPTADDKGIARYDQGSGVALAARILESQRVRRRTVSFRTNAFDLAPGVVFRLQNHPKSELGPGSSLLVSELVLRGEVGQEWTAEVGAVFTADPYRPELTTEKPAVHGVQSAIVVGPPGDSVHTDEFGRVRVQFLWDRTKAFDDGSSCWIRVSQAWAGSRYGHVVLPRIGHEVLVAFVDGNPDQPIVVGRVFNGAAQVPYKLPGSKLVSAWKSDSNSNIIVFDDTPKEEGFFTQAEKNRVGIVKKDETYLTGGKRVLAIGKEYKSRVGKKQSHFAGKEYKSFAGKKVSSGTIYEWSGKAGFNASVKSGKEVKLAVQPVVPVVMAIIDFFQDWTKLKKALPDGPPDLSAVLPSFTKGSVTVKSAKTAPPKMLSKEKIDEGIEDVVNLLGLALKGKSSSDLADLFDDPVEEAIAKLLDDAKAAGLIPAKLLPLANLAALLEHLQNLLDAILEDGKSTAPKLAKAKKPKKEEDSSAVDVLQDVAQAILDRIVPTTKVSVEHQKIGFKTKKAKIELKEDSITFKADKDIEIKAGGTIKIEGASVKIKPDPCKGSKGGKDAKGDKGDKAAKPAKSPGTEGKMDASSLGAAAGGAAVAAEAGKAKK